MAATDAAKEAVSLHRLTSELGLDDPSAAVDLNADNQAAIDVAYNPEHHTRMKHVERQHFFVRELVERHKLRVPFVSTHDNLADFFTKPLAARLFFPLRNTIMNVPAHLATGGRCESVTAVGKGPQPERNSRGGLKRNVRGNHSLYVRGA